MMDAPQTISEPVTLPARFAAVAVPLVVVESPFAAPMLWERQRNMAYARAALADCLCRGEAPFASHLLYTQQGVLNDDDPAERRLGISSGLSWAMRCDYAAFYMDYGMSTGMLAASEFYAAHGIRTETRYIGRNGG